MATSAQLSQLLLEILRLPTEPAIQLSQVTLEVLRVNGAEGPIPIISTQPVINVIT